MLKRISQAAFTAILFVSMAGCGGTDTTQQAQEQEPEQSREEFMVELLDDLDGIEQGSENASVVVHEFLDYQCPACRTAALNFVEDFKSRYVESGQVRFVYLDFPLTRIHQNAISSSVSAWCADRHDIFNEYQKVLFQRQDDWEDLPGSEAREMYVEIAGSLGAEEEGFNECMDSEEIKTTVQENLNAGRSFGVRGTPTFFVNGELIQGSGAQIMEAVNRNLQKASN